MVTTRDDFDSEQVVAESGEDRQAHIPGDVNHHHWHDGALLGIYQRLEFGAVDAVDPGIAHGSRGAVNLGFVLIAGNYLMSWLLGVVYARISANRHDPLVKLVIDRAATRRRSQ